MRGMKFSYIIILITILSLSGCNLFGGDSTPEPEATISLTGAQAEREEMLLSASESISYASDKTLTYEWSVHPEAKLELSNNGENAVLTIPDVGELTEFTINLTVTDAKGKVSSDTVSFEVENVFSKVSIERPTLKYASIAILDEDGLIIDEGDSGHDSEFWLQNSLLEDDKIYRIIAQNGEIITGDENHYNYGAYQLLVDGVTLKENSISMSVLSTALAKSVEGVYESITQEELWDLLDKNAGSLFKENANLTLSPYKTVITDLNDELLVSGLIEQLETPYADDSLFDSFYLAFGQPSQDKRENALFNFFSDYFAFNSREHSFITSTKINLSLLGKGRIFSNSGDIDYSDEDPEFETRKSFLIDTDEVVTLTPEPSAGYVFADWVGCPVVKEDVCYIEPKNAINIGANFIQPEVNYTGEVFDITGYDFIYENDTFTIDVRRDDDVLFTKLDSLSDGDILAGLLTDGSNIILEINHVADKQDEDRQFTFEVSSKKISDIVDSGTLYFNKKITNLEIQQGAQGSGVSYQAGSLIQVDENKFIRLSDDPLSDKLEMLVTSQDVSGSCGIDSTGFGCYASIEKELVGATEFNRTIGGVDINGGASITVSSYFSITVMAMLDKDGNGDVLSAGVSMLTLGAIDGEARATVTAEASGEKTKSHVIGGLNKIKKSPFSNGDVASKRGQIAIPAMPPFVYINPVLDFSITGGFAANGELEATWEAKARATSMMGVKYTKVGGTKVDFSSSISASSPELNADIKAQLDVSTKLKVEASIKVNTVEVPVSVSMEAGPELSYLATSEDDQCGIMMEQKLEVKGSAEAKTTYDDGIDIGFWTAPIPTDHKLSYTKDLFSETLLRNYFSLSTEDVGDTCSMLSYAYSNSIVEHEYSSDEVGVKLLENNENGTTFSVANTSRIDGYYSLNYLNENGLFSVSLYKAGKEGKDDEVIEDFDIGSKITIKGGDIHLIKVKFDLTKAVAENAYGENALSINLKHEDLPRWGALSKIKDRTFNAVASVKNLAPPQAPTNLRLSSSSSLITTLLWDYSIEEMRRLSGKDLRFDVYVNGDFYRSVSANDRQTLQSVRLRLYDFGKVAVRVVPVANSLENVNEANAELTTRSVISGRYVGTYSWNCGAEPSRQGSLSMVADFELGTMHSRMYYEIEGKEYSYDANVSYDDEETFFYYFGSNIDSGRFKIDRNKVMRGNTINGMDCSHGTNIWAGSFTLYKQ